MDCAIELAYDVKTWGARGGTRSLVIGRPYFMTRVPALLTLCNLTHVLDFVLEENVAVALLRSWELN